VRHHNVSTQVVLQLERLAARRTRSPHGGGVDSPAVFQHVPARVVLAPAVRTVVTFRRTPGSGRGCHRRRSEPGAQHLTLGSNDRDGDDTRLRNWRPFRKSGLSLTASVTPLDVGCQGIVTLERFSTRGAGDQIQLRAGGRISRSRDAGWIGGFPAAGWVGCLQAAGRSGCLRAAG